MNALPAAARAFLACLSLSSLPLAHAATEEHSAENLAVFARVFGYVRFFHPSDAAAAADWDRVGILGAEAVRDADTPEKLRRALLDVFHPLAPTLELASEPRPVASPAPSGRLLFWQHMGLNLAGGEGPYRRERVINDDERTHAHLFKPATPPSAINVPLAPGLALWLPSALPIDAQGRTTAATPEETSALHARLAAIDPNALTPADWRVRVAGVITIWSAFQHFHPYLDVAGVKWDEALRPALRRALRDPNGEDYYATLSELVARTRDGHGYVYMTRDEIGGLPVRVKVIEDRVVVIGVAGEVSVRKGDIVRTLDGVPALDVVLGLERISSGSPHLSLFRALNQFGEGPAAQPAQLVIERDGARQSVTLERSTRHRGYFFKAIGEFEFPGFAEVRPGIFYLNLYSLSAPALEEKLATLAQARGVIVDWRSDGRYGLVKQGETINPHQHIIPHLIEDPVYASPMLVPQITQPDRAGWSYQRNSWPVRPKEPRWRGKVVFINEPSVVSYGETCMAMIAGHHLATLVGAPTAGTNGNVSFIPLPGKMRVMWTAMDVRRTDETPFYGVGFAPDFPVTRTLAAVRAGRDEYLEKAIEVIEQATQRKF